MGEWYDSWKPGVLLEVRRRSDQLHRQMMELALPLATEPGRGAGLTTVEAFYKLATARVRARGAGR